MSDGEHERLVEFRSRQRGRLAVMTRVRLIRRIHLALPEAETTLCGRGRTGLESTDTVMRGDHWLCAACAKSRGGTASA